MKLNQLSKKVFILGLSATIGFTALGLGAIPFTSTVSAATAYETKVVSGVNLRSQPSTGASELLFLSKGESVHVISKVNSYWLKVETKTGQTGYISANKKYTNYTGSGNQVSTGSGGSQPGGTQPGTGTEVSTSSNADKVISLAQSYSGRISYGFGKRDTNRLIFDCSSFTQFIFRQVGVELKWGTKDQKSQGSAVSKNNLRKGDLIFFDTIGSNNGVINHVGIYMGGDKFIHNTPSSNGISINSLSTGWWATKYVSSRRVL
ncbi:C40 family peptidase [Paenibacillus sp. sgz302251]|uniref:C40 family peptidase n=1 Tax=Paenibacillus sp. sgz302251 TaxID=3414493 RepID=UPI003C7C41B3